MRWLINFIFPSRIQRLDYLWRILTTNLAVGLILASSSPFENLSAWLGLIALFAYQLFFILLPRVRDTGMSGWWVLLSLVPIVYIFLGIILVFRPSEYHFERSLHEAEET
jgi:uncharacterized membrane protein YhaH (DUF805 family)